MIILVWNCHGVGQPSAVQALRELTRSHRPGVVFLYETKVSNSDNTTKVGKSLVYTNSHVVAAYGSSGSLLMLWSDTVSIKIMVDNMFMIHCVVENDGSS